MSRETITLLLNLLTQVTLSGGDPDLAEKTKAIIQARSELNNELNDLAS